MHHRSKPPLTHLALPNQRLDELLPSTARPPDDEHDPRWRQSRGRCPLMSGHCPSHRAPVLRAIRRCDLRLIVREIEDEPRRGRYILNGARVETDTHPRSFLMPPASLRLRLLPPGQPDDSQLVTNPR